MTRLELLAALLVERFGPDAADTISPPPPLPPVASAARSRPRPRRHVPNDIGGMRGPVSSALPPARHAKGTTLEELLAEW